MKKFNLSIIIIFIITAFLISSNKIYSQWIITGELAGVTGTRPQLSVVDGNTAFVTGGAIVNATYKTTNGGMNWIQLNTGTLQPFWAIGAANATNVVAGTDASGNVVKFYKTTDGGFNWTIIDSFAVTGAGVPGFKVIRYCHSIPSFGIAYAEGNNGDAYIYKTRDAGNTWTRSVLPGYPGYNISGGLNVIDSLFYAFGSHTGSPSTIITTDGGVTWNLRNLNLPSASLNITRGLAFKDDKLTAIASSSSFPIISRTTNGGLNWVNINVGNNATNPISGTVMRWIPGTDRCYLTAAGSTAGLISGVLKSIDGGLNWSPMSTGGLGINYMDMKLIGENTHGYAISAVPGAFGGNVVLKLFEDNPLPVELSSFISFVTGRNVKLKWTTATEENNSGFDIERSVISAGQWSKIGHVNGNGSTNSPSNYEFTDKNLLSGKYKYRLQQIDYNGNFEYYALQNEVVIEVPEKYELSQNYPNPFNPGTVISYTIGTSQLAAGSIASLKIYDVLGNEVATLINEKQNAGYYEIDFNGSNLSSGVYFYKLAVDGNVIDTKRMVLLR